MSSWIDIREYKDGVVCNDTSSNLTWSTLRLGVLPENLALTRFLAFSTGKRCKCSWLLLTGATCSGTSSHSSITISGAAISWSDLFVTSTSSNSSAGSTPLDVNWS